MTDNSSILLALFLGIVGILAYFLPLMIAAERDHPSTGAILALNLLLGWTFLGWVVALVWALAGARAPRAVTPTRASVIRAIPTDPRPGHSPNDDDLDDELITKVVGVTHTNDDGTDRQAIIAGCKAGESVILRAEPTNKFDANAIAVYSSRGQQIGYLSRERAASLHGFFTGEQPELRAGITQVTGGTRAKPIYGVNILAHAAHFSRIASSHGAGS